MQSLLLRVPCLSCALVFCPFTVHCAAVWSRAHLFLPWHTGNLMRKNRSRRSGRRARVCVGACTWSGASARPGRTGELAASVCAAYFSDSLHSFVRNLKNRQIFLLFQPPSEFFVKSTVFFFVVLLNHEVWQCEVGLLLCFLNAEIERSGWAHHPPWNPPFLFFIGYTKSPPPPQNLTPSIIVYLLSFLVSLVSTCSFFKLKVSQSDLSLNSCKTPHSLDFCPSLKPKAVTHRLCEPLSSGAAPNKVWKHSPRSSTIWDTVAISTFILLYLFNCLDAHYLSY